jgi:hypothetical protein
MDCLNSHDNLFAEVLDWSRDTLDDTNSFDAIKIIGNVSSNIQLRLFLEPCFRLTKYTYVFDEKGGFLAEIMEKG